MTDQMIFSSTVFGEGLERLEMPKLTFYPKATVVLRFSARRTLVSAGLAHALHDGFTSSIYMLLPLWQAQFGLGFGALAALRAIYVGSLAGFQIPSARLSRHIGIPLMLAVGTLVSACGFALGGMVGGLLGLGVALAVAGAGGSTQHPLASAAVTQAYGKTARGPLGTYNFAGDLGKASFPPLLAILLATLGSRQALLAMAISGAVVAILIFRLMPVSVDTPAIKAPTNSPITGSGRDKDKTGFKVLLLIGMLDSAVGVGLLLFLPALLATKGSSAASLGLALSLIFLGGACGKATCGWMAARIGLVTTVIVTEVGTMTAVMALIALPLTPALVLFPILGVMLNGTSSVLYGTVPEFAGTRRTEHAFAIFYSCTLGSSAAAPMLYGVLGDVAGPDVAVAAAAATALAVVPFILFLSSRLSGD
jgi:MFS transporter, FSR family, fosmidomycin resistance protein